VEVDPRYYRPTEVDLLLGDAAKARAELGWEPQLTMEAMAREMVESDLDAARAEVVSASSQHDED
jgi:GDPmannose 4,6-dehydratase